MNTHTVHTVEETHQLGHHLIQQMIHGTIPSTLLLSGDLGGGKTTFTQGLGQALGMTRPLPSPTYTIIRPYDIPQTNQDTFTRLIHADLYRITAPWEVEELELAQYATDPHTILVIEWPEKAPQLQQTLEHTHLTFEVKSPQERIITIQ